MEWTIHQVAKATGTTSRTLRHYADIGLLAPSRVGANGYRYYDDAALRRYQRILLLRELGLGLAAIAEVLDERTDEVSALRAHAGLLEAEAARLTRLAGAVRETLRRTEEGEELDVTTSFDGFDASRYEDEVVQRWGRDAHEDAQRAWRGMGEEGRAAHGAEADAIGRGLAAAAARGAAPDEGAVQDLVRRHHAWVSRFWVPGADAYRGLTAMYVDDERFRTTYEAYGPGTAVLLRDAAEVLAQRELA
ncbi:MerR family transcriptional regulator [Paenibacillus sp. TRM 82003]|uniref:MerR family transcriptional regulator n=1 Tax=Kineococcus sp. TRM81007 TaxID=2925831 RepID=UPI001F599259|nr:MerR family transcriptional regulator [Kineococcus sp. TRM81007]MCI2238452.1 MerR family transcriptional regulator [Kineococcus sp. TRM81007]MCI3922034.1 MerR family transcriptional regulator [Paenibacillus sp. TRM 82003]